MAIFKQGLFGQKPGEAALVLCNLPLSESVYLYLLKISLPISRLQGWLLKNKTSKKKSEKHIFTYEHKRGTSLRDFWLALFVLGVLICMPVTQKGQLKMYVFPS